VKFAAFQVVTPYVNIKRICSVVVPKISIHLLCDLFTQAKCFLFRDGVSTEHGMYYNYIKRKRNRNRKETHICNWKSMKVFMGWSIVRLLSYCSSTLYKCVCMCVCMCVCVCVRARARISDGQGGGENN
jgi:hypothetical protein